MSGVFALVAWVAVLNPPRSRLGLPESSSGRVDPARLGTGVAIGATALFGVGFGAGTLLDTLDVSPETFRIAAGLVLVISAALMLFVSEPPAEPEAVGLGRQVWPVAYPRFISPESLSFAITVGASDGIGSVIPGLVVSGAAWVMLGLAPRGPLSRRLLANSGRLVAVVVMVVGIWLALQGVREV